MRARALVAAVALLCASCGESTNPNGPKQLGITLGQVTATAGTALSIQVTIQDASGSTVLGSSAPVTLALEANPGSATLLGAVTVNAANGVATFPDVNITKAAQGYTLVASSPGLTSATSEAFQVVAGPAIEIEFVTPPASTVTAGAALAPAIQVAVHDQYDNTVTTATGGVTITLEPNVANATLSGTTTAALSSGVATFANLTIDKTSPGLQLKATSGTFLPILTAAFAVSAGAAAKLAFLALGTTFESGAFLGETVGFNVRVQILDANDNLVTSGTNSVTIAIGANPGSGTLAGLLARAAVAGEAQFSGVSINKVGSGYTLVASAAGLQSGTSTAFEITPGTPTQIAWSVQPAPSADPGVALPAFRIELLDAAGNVATGRQGYFVQLSIASGPAGGKLVEFGGSSGAVVDGYATFTGIRFDRPGTYTIRASSGYFAAKTSDPVAVAPLAFSKVTVGGGPAFSFPVTQARHTCALSTLGVAYCWGSGIWGATGLSPSNSIVDAFEPQLVATTQLFKDADAGNLHTCAVTLAGAAYCWGSDINGRLGDADPQQGTKGSPVAVSGGLTFVSISAGDTHTCGVTSSGAGALSGPVYCWGSNSSGQLGDGTFDERNMPTLVAGGLAFIAVSASHGQHTCGITTDFLAYCWGLNIDGQLGDASTTTRNVPTLVQDAATHLFRSISTGRFHSCAVRADNATYCWGANTSQQLGDGNTAQTDRTTPSLVTTTTTAVSSGWLHTCGIAVGGSGALCWGANDGGQLGDGGTTERNAAAPVSGSLGITQVASGQDFSCGVTADNNVYCWGVNAFGQLGDGTTTQRLTPIRVLP